APSAPVSESAGASPQALCFRRRRLHGHARTRSSADQRTEGEVSFLRDAGSESWFCAASPGRAAAAQPSVASQSLRARGRTRLAEALLRFRQLDSAQACGETALHAPQSSAAGSGGVAGTVALEQFPRLLVWRRRACRGEQM